MDTGQTQTDGRTETVGPARSARRMRRLSVCRQLCTNRIGFGSHTPPARQATDRDRPTDLRLVRRGFKSVASAVVGRTDDELGQGVGSSRKSAHNLLFN